MHLLTVLATSCCPLTACLQQPIGKGLVLERFVGKALHVLAFVEPPVAASLATPYARECLGIQLPIWAALCASMTPLLLLGAWCWAKSRMMARVNHAKYLLDHAVEGTPFPQPRTDALPSFSPYPALPQSTFKSSQRVDKNDFWQREDTTSAFISL